MDSEYGELLYRTEVRWLSRGNVLKRFFALRNKIALFMKMKNMAVSLLADATFQCNLAFLSDPSQQCYSGPIRALQRLPVRDPYRFGRERCSGPAWANRKGLMWFSVLSSNQKLKHANKLIF